jgi:dihydrofolate reductase
MGKVTAGATVSLDGFIARPDDSVGPLFDWFSAGDTPFKTPGGHWSFTVSAASAALMAETWRAVGALVTGRRTFDYTDGWGGERPLGVPVVVVTSRPTPEAWREAHPGAPFTFVTEGGVERAVAEAMAIAGDKDVSVGMASVVQQCLATGLLDEVAIDLAPVTLGEGIRYLDLIGEIRLEQVGLVQGTGVTHLRYRVLR